MESAKRYISTYHPKDSQSEEEDWSTAPGYVNQYAKKSVVSQELETEEASSSDESIDLDLDKVRGRQLPQDPTSDAFETPYPQLIFNEFKKLKKFYKEEELSYGNPSPFSKQDFENFEKLKELLKEKEPSNED